MHRAVGDAPAASRRAGRGAAQSMLSMLPVTLLLVAVSAATAGHDSGRLTAAHFFYRDYTHCWRVHYSEPAYVVLHCHEIGAPGPHSELAALQVDGGLALPAAAFAVPVDRFRERTDARRA
ncbi:MAG: hypothetical protein H6920_00105 [Sphingomonadaceae bacterium]|nr:hypothetical protein [Sphingomonadaceae bacterium]